MQLSVFKKYIKITRGFSMIELLVVMSIIGLMATFGVMTYPGVQKNSRDTKRRSDLKQYQTSLESFANSKGGFYPSRTSQTYASDMSGNAGDPDLCTDMGLSQCPVDPKKSYTICAGAGVCEYYYWSNGTNTTPTATSYVLYSRLENKVNDNYVFFVICGSGVSGTVVSSSWTPSATCPL
ncbi:MAG: hypothetical protein UT39_C0001G0059 [Candidatus Woesebacteria bacterium GW2011_GWA1_39_21]|uniref:General secretion pathway protein G n=1 Tax=Candidatus Woesebacteria bacterium GW2011_GWA1_39_21 TaxID=1618550 RepID=A0A0G0N754_9BACT|nr:MAG: hypothetical protein UT39_C0001G0059 [Candidatus Woesebacteria bacterium GW2011_GWA1_39_21]